jgi:hypothetical protein
LALESRLCRGVHGNTESYWYGKEVNNYAPNLKKTDLADYVRGRTLKRIDYGTWDRGSADRSVTARAQIVSGTDDRCKSDCARHGDNWPDVPWDQECKADAGTRRWRPGSATRAGPRP